MKPVCFLIRYNRGVDPNRKSGEEPGRRRTCCTGKKISFNKRGNVKKRVSVPRNVCLYVITFNVKEIINLKKKKTVYGRKERRK